MVTGSRPVTGRRVGRILLEHERAARMTDETAASIGREVLRSAFAVSAEHVLTAWHCVRAAAGRRERLWFRLRDTESRAGSGHVYLPVAVLEHDEAFDVAVLVVDESRLGEAGLSGDDAARLLARSVIRLGVDVSVHEPVRVMGFPANAPSAADSDTLSARVVDLALPLGAVTGLKLEGPSLAAVDPVDGHGLSGGPVLKSENGGTERAVGVVRWVPRGQCKSRALGGALIATRIEDVAASLPQVAAALLADASGPVTAGPKPPGASLAGLLRPDTGLVEFLGREEERRDLHAWCDGPARRGAWLVTGPAGQGKTRLAMQLCTELTSSGKWAARILRGPGDTTDVGDLCRRAAAADWSLLLVVDYASEFGAAAFAELMSTLTGDAASSPRWRLLLLARHAGEWWRPQSSGGASATALRPQLVAVGAEVPEKDLALKPLIPDPQARGRVFDEILAQLRPAVAAFAARHGMTVADPPAVSDLSVADLGSALMLHVAAVTSLLPPAGRPLDPAEPPSASDLINRILDLECQRHWLYADVATARLYRPTEEAFGDLARSSGGGDVVETAVAAATLAGAPTAYAAGQLLTRVLDVPPAQARAIGGWLHDLYPAAEASPETTWLPPLQPDLLGEELVARVIHREHRNGVPPGQLLPRRILGSSPDSLAASQIRRLVTVMFRAGLNHRDIAGLLADGTERGGLIGDIPDEVDLSTIAYALPKADIDCLGAAVAITAHAVRHYDRTQAGCDSEDPQLLHNLAYRLDQARRPEEAVAAAERAVAAFARLAATRRDALPDLARSLDGLALLLIRAGRPAEALAAAKRSVDILTRLAQIDEQAHLPDLANSLTNLSQAQGALGRPEALATGERALLIQDRLVSADPEAHEPDVAISLLNVSNRLAEVGRREDALAAAKRAAGLYKRLAQDSPHAYLPGLAQSLDNLADRLAKAEQLPESLQAREQAVAGWELLANANPDAFLADLAKSLGQLARDLNQAGRLSEALDVSEKEVRAYKALAQASPEAHLPHLAVILHNRASWLAHAGHPAEALDADDQALAIWNGLAQADPETYLPHVAWLLDSMSGHLGGLGRLREAVTVAERAVGVFKQLENVSSDALAILAGSLNNLSLYLTAAGRQAEALAAAKRGVAIWEGLAQADPYAYLPGLTASLISLSKTGGRAEADQAWENAATRLGPTVDMRLLHAGWNWVSAPTLEAERDRLAAHPELLANRSEDQLIYVLRFLSPNGAKRYRALLTAARERGVDEAYRG